MSASAQLLFRTLYGVLLFGTLLMLLPTGKRFFMSEKWRGYVRSSRPVNVIQNPFLYPVIMTVWLTCAVGLIVGKHTVLSAVVNLIFCHYYFIQMRWKGLARGLGAPGFMTYWLSVAVCLLEYTSYFAPSVRWLALVVLRIDFACVMLSAAIYKFRSGYGSNYGMNDGMANPEWGYAWKYFSTRNPNHWGFKFLNHAAWVGQGLTALLLFLPPTHMMGTLLLIGIFGFIATQLRLGLLSEMMMLCGMLYFSKDIEFPWLAPFLTTTAENPAGWFSWADGFLRLFLIAYLVLLPLAYAGLFYNFYERKSLPLFFQGMLEKYTNLFGIILWRVFSIDVVDFFARIFVCDRWTNKKTLISHYGWRGWPRFSHVGESITITGLFTPLKYYPSQKELFHERLLRYARTLPYQPGEFVTFEYVKIVHGKDTFEHVPIREYRVDPECSRVEERVLAQDPSIGQAVSASLVHETKGPGSYAPTSLSARTW